MHIALNPNFDTSILSAKAQSGRAFGILTAENIEIDELALSTRKQEEMEVDILDVNMAIKEEEREVHAYLRLQHTRDIVKLQTSYEVHYKEGHNYQSLQTLTLIPEDKSALTKTYMSKKPIGHIIMVHKNIHLECKRVNTFLMTAHRYDKVLIWELGTLAKKEEYCRFIEKALKK